MVVKEFNVGIDKKQNNTIISNVYKDLLKIKYDEVIDLKYNQCKSFKVWGNKIKNLPSVLSFNNL